VTYLICEYHNSKGKEESVEMKIKDALKNIKRAHDSARKVMCKTEKEHVLYAVKIYSKSEMEKIMIYRNLCLSDSELDEYIKDNPSAMFYVLHASTCKLGCKTLVERSQKRRIRPITLKLANDFVNKYHRHHGGTVGCKFAIGLYEMDCLIGVAVCGRPVNRYLDDGKTCEINRVCTSGGENACSMLYAACCRTAKGMGYEKIITYILKSESGVTLKASNFTYEGEAGGTHWTGKRNRGQNIPAEMKTRWCRMLAH